MTYYKDDLNKSVIPGDNYVYESVHFDKSVIFKDHQTTVDARVDVYFRDLEYHLIENIKKYKCVVGCVAWLTNKEVLKALADLEFVSIIVQKEDFLRPDSNNGYSSGEKLRCLYSQIKTFIRCGMSGVAGEMCTGSLQEPNEAIRCAGIYQQNKKITFPRMHHKFLVFCEKLEPKNDDWGDNHELAYWPYKPKEVWTGSFNFTKNGTQSLENAVVISSNEVALSYYHEWAQILGISEPLDWHSPWVEPEWRIGT
jgi:hypothetical protein